MRLLHLFSLMAWSLTLGMCGRATAEFSGAHPLASEHLAADEHTSLVSYEPRATPAERIISLGGDDMLANLISVGIQPTAALIDQGSITLHETRAERSGMQILDAGKPLDLQQIQALRPSLIIGTDEFVNRELEQQLQRIAPTVLVSSDPIQEYVETLNLLGMRDRVQDDLNMLHTTIAHTSAQWPSGKSVSVAHLHRDAAGTFTITEADHAKALLSELGFELRPAVLPSSSPLAALDGERLILFYDGAEQYTPALTWLQSQPEWRSLPAVRTGHISLLNRCDYPGFQGQRQLTTVLEKLGQ